MGFRVNRTMDKKTRLYEKQRIIAMQAQYLADIENLDQKPDQ